MATAAVVVAGLTNVPAQADMSATRALSVPSNNWDYVTINTSYFHDVLARDTAGDLWVYPGDGLGGWKKPRFKMGEGWNVMTAIVGPGKFQSEFTDDLLARDANGDLWLYPGTGAGILKPRMQVGVGWNVMTALVGPGDFNGDYMADLMARDAEGRLWLYPGDHQGGWLPRFQIGEGWNVMTALIGRGDFNEDRKMDLLARDTSGGLWLYPGNGTGGWLPRMQVGEGWNTMTAIIATGNFDNNYEGYAQIIARDTNGILWLYAGIGSRHLEPRKQIGEGWNIMTALV
ncbi:FG-GAP repeat domain-containing protein [Paenarthrobacter sp. YIM B13468]